MIRAVLDENVPRPLARLLRDSGLDVSAFPRRVWRGAANGHLMSLVERAGYTVFVTSDQSIPFQQNLTGRAFGLVVLPRNDLSTLANDLDSIVAAIETVQAGACVRVSLRSVT